MQVVDIVSWLRRMLGDACVVVDGTHDDGLGDVDNGLIVDMTATIDSDMIEDLLEVSEQEWAVITTTCELGNKLFDELYENTAFVLIGEEYAVFIYTDSEDTEDKIYKYFPADWHILIPGRAG